MAILEKDIILTRKTATDTEILYPYTIMENIDGLDGTLNTKVDKIEGKGLSTNDFTNIYKSKLDNGFVVQKDSKGFYIEF